MSVEIKIVDKWLHLLERPAAQTIIQNATEASNSVMADLLTAVGASVDRDLLRTTNHLHSQVNRYSGKATVFNGRLKRVVHNVKNNRYPFFQDNILDHPFDVKTVTPKMEPGEEIGQPVSEGMRKPALLPTPATGWIQRQPGEGTVPRANPSGQYRVWTPEPREW
jgi:hypothetical protein